MRENESEYAAICTGLQILFFWGPFEELLSFLK